MKRTSTKTRTILGLFSVALALAPVMAWLTSPVSHAGSPSFSTSITYVPIYANNAAYSPLNGKLYVSVPSQAGKNGNRIAIVNPETGVVENSVFIGSEPNLLALSSDNQKLFVGLDGARSIREFDPATQTAGAQYGAGFDSWSGPLRILDLVAAPDNPNRIAVARCISGGVDCYAGNAIFDNGTLLPGASGKSNSIAFGDSSSSLYGASVPALVFERMSVNSRGVTTPYNSPLSSGGRIKYHNGRVYSSRGQVLDALTGNSLGNIDLGVSLVEEPTFVIDGPNNRIFFIARNQQTPKQVRAFNLETLAPIGSIDLPVEVGPTDLDRWGTDGLAISSSYAPMLLIRSTLVDPNSDVQNTPNPVFPAPTPQPTAYPASVRQIAQASNDIVFNPADGNLYASVPANATNGTANSIARISPVTGTVSSFTPVGTEPAKMGLSDDGHSLYVALNGPNHVRRFDTSTMTPGLEFEIDGSSARATDVEVVPGSPDSIVVAGTGTFVVWDNGVDRPNRPNPPPYGSGGGVSEVEFASPNTLYRYSNNVLMKIGVDAQGLTTLDHARSLLIGDMEYDEMKFSGGRLYTASGRVVNPDTKTMAGTFPGLGSSIALDNKSRKAFMPNGGIIGVYDMDTFVKLGYLTVPNTNGAAITHIVRWGADGLAVRLDGGPTDQKIVFLQSPLVGSRSTFDFDGDGKSDISVFRPSDGNWYIQQSAAGYTAAHFGASSDDLVPADYDGDGKTDVAVFRNGAWYLLGSQTGFRAFNFGQTGDVPQPADFNGDGQAELAVFRPSDGGWYKLDLNGNVFTAVNFGQNGDKPVVGDYDGDQKADPAVYRGGAWYILGSTQGYYAVNFGIATDKVVPADYDGDGKTDQAVVRDGFWYMLRSSAGYTGFQWGLATDAPVAADYDGDGKTDVSVYRDGQWYLLQSGAGYAGANFGLSTDKPVPNAFVQ